MTSPLTRSLAACSLLGTAFAMPALNPSAAAAEPTRSVTAAVLDLARGDLGGHPDFNTAGSTGRAGLTPGMVEQVLGADGLPVYAAVRPVNAGGNDPLTGAANFHTWFNPEPGVNHATTVDIHFGPRADDPSILTTEGYNDGVVKNGQYFPIDDFGFGREGYSHNYSFTTRFALPFSYIAGGNLIFSGDDDVWAFINGRLAIDLGGTHLRVASSVMLLDGKMFVETANIPVGGHVNALSAADHSRLQTDWTRLGLPGSLPLATDTHGWIDLGLPPAHDSRCLFAPDGQSVEVFTAGPPPASVRLVFNDGRGEVLAWAGNGAAYAGSGVNAGKPLAGLELVSADGALVYHSPAGRGGAECRLDFFHAERNYSQSNFRIDTTLLGDPEASRAELVGFD